MPAPADREAWRLSLPRHPEHYRTGAVWLDEDPRDYLMRCHPGVPEVKAVGIPPAADNSQFVKGMYDQGMEGSCVSWSDCSAVSTEGVIGGGPWQILDGEAFYHENGGTGQNGIDTRQSLQRAVDLGIPLANSSGRVRIGSYFFASRDPVQFIADCEAAVAASKCVVVAMLLPNPFGWDSGENPTSGYHQMDLVGYDPLWWIFANSWGAGFGKNGFVRVKKSYIVGNNLQNSYAYAASVDSLLIPKPTPTPVPPVPVPVPVKQRVLSAVATGEGIGTLAVGQNLTTGNVNLNITQIADGQPAPIPTPDPGPGPAPTPTPVGDVIVNVAVGRPGRARIISATVQDKGTLDYLEANCTAQAGTQALGMRLTHPSGATAMAAVWLVAGQPVGTVVTVAATAADGRTGVGQVTL